MNPPGMRPGKVSFFCALALLGCVGGGCAPTGRNNTETATEFVTRAGPEARRTRQDIAYYAKANALEVEDLKLDAENFLEWRRREWWNLQDETAWQVTYEWENVEKLSKDVARSYGYEIRNFPKGGHDVAEFIHRAGPEWRSLVQDVQIFLEYKDREKMPLRRDLRQFYERTRWEAANLGADVTVFLRWREREYRKLIKDGRDFFAAGGLELLALKRDIERLRAEAAATGHYLIADFKAFGNYEAQQVPRLVDDVANFTRWREDDWRQLKRSVADVGRNASEDAKKLMADIEKYHHYELSRIPALMRDVDEFFASYEREVHPLSEDVKRFWRANIAAGHLLMVDLKEFFAASQDETALLQIDIRNFLSYGTVEWRHLVKTIKDMSKDNAARIQSNRSMIPVPFNDHKTPRNGP